MILPQTRFYKACGTPLHFDPKANVQRAHITYLKPWPQNDTFASCYETLNCRSPDDVMRYY
ncbi:hypothetical protein HanRHA438_Chr04g0175251 [Helianthus annuus]|nr:hypothetical protein HanIR_Chr04g0178591 [Helianthus annuus]KAJ0926782.1 hypothetical protein HanRHA438_Chr04g0175251 [Helianthus annuus]